MPKKRQIPFLRPPRTLADGTKVYDWKPTRALQQAGWKQLVLRGTEIEVNRQALELNAQVAEWRQRGNAAIEGAPRPDDGPRLVRWDGLIARYRKARDYADLKDSTRKEYDSRLRWLRGWALDGQLVIRQIDHTMVQDLKRALENASSSDHRTAAILRVLRLLLGFAEREGIIAHGTNPARNAKIREPRSRRHVLSLEAVEAMAARAASDGLPHIELAIALGFWTLQREGDLLGNFNRMAWREVHDIEARDRGLLAGRGGRVMAFRIQQDKTGAWVDAVVPPFLHDPIEAGFKALPPDERTLLRDDAAGAGGKPLSEWRLQRQWRDLRATCAAEARAGGRLLLADELATAQFRDLRRSGQVYMRDAGAKKEWITSLSGHTILQKKSILDTYMPGDTAAACAAVACALRLRNRRKKEKTG